MLSKILLDKLRVGPWLVAGLVLIIFSAEAHPNLVDRLLLALALLFLGSWLGYWIDRTLFPYARPGDLFRAANRLAAGNVHEPEGGRSMRHEASLAAIRRAVLVAMVIFVLSLGV
ncbi:putative holin [Halomonas sp.]|uniref:putative holin n=1 Tax=Halomonas sp. TaxID=1486246 RepID=UPI00298D6DA1|nr:putative holin [Halomonas sp.]MDW7746566.1 putative holin [Halomonas sp.]